MENVAGLLKVKRNARHFIELLEIVRQDYFIDFDVLNSLDFGVPQFRERVFVIGINKNKCDFKDVKIRLDGRWFKFPENKLYFNAAKKYAWPSPSPFGKCLTLDNNLPLLFMFGIFALYPRN